MKEQFIIMAIAFAVAGVTGFDFVTYTLKAAPKRSVFSKRVWWLGLICFIIAIYWLINDKTLYTQ